MGKLKTEESRKEMRKRPGAPNAPAKVTTFSFQPVRGCGDGNEESLRESEE